MPADNSERKQRGRPFMPGRSGNPKGKPKGTRNKATMMVLQLMEGAAEEITRTVLSSARNGDLGAAKLVLERLAPPLRERPVCIDLPDTGTPEGCSQAQSAILLAVGAGDLLPSEGAVLAGIVENRRRSIETVELESRIAALEEVERK